MTAPTATGLPAGSHPSGTAVDYFGDMLVNIRNTEDDVFNRWRRKDESFVVDGAPNPTAFIASRVKTVIVLKEVNAPKLRGDFDLRHQLENDPDSWWRTVANWCAALSHFEEAQPWAKLQALPIKACLAPVKEVCRRRLVGFRYDFEICTSRCKRNPGAVEYLPTRCDRMCGGWPDSRERTRRYGVAPHREGNEIR